MPEPHIFMISGLGADSRAFRNLKLNTTQITHLDWLEPQKGETLKHYSYRISEPVRQAQNPILIGLSLGGLISGEIKKMMPEIPIILISSLKDIQEKPFLLKIGKIFPLHRIIPPRLVMKSTVIVRSVFGKLDKPDLAVFNDMFMKSSPRFLRWGMHQAVHWKGGVPKHNVFHIHGTRDRLFPHKPIKNAFWVEGGTHYMVHTKAREVSDYINEILAGLVK
jgi:hypothetical protein